MFQVGDLVEWIQSGYTSAMMDGMVRLDRHDTPYAMVGGYDEHEEYGRTMGATSQPPRRVPLTL